MNKALRNITKHIIQIVAGCVLMIGMVVFGIPIVGIIALFVMAQDEPGSLLNEHDLLPLLMIMMVALCCLFWAAVL